MKLSATLGAILFTTSALGGCTTSKPPSPPPLEIVPQSIAEAEAAPAPVKSEDPLAQQSPQVQATVRQHQQDGAAWQVFTTERSQLYPYSEGPEPVIDCEPLRSTDIQLGAGETITDVVLGDSGAGRRPAASGDPRAVPHVAIASGPGIKANLTVYTTRHLPSDPPPRSGMA